MKRILTALTAALCLVTGAWADADNCIYTVDGISWSYTLHNDGSATIAHKDSAGNYTTAISTATQGPIVVPGELNGHTVRGIDDRAFYGCTGITSVRIDGAITNVGALAFQNCTSLKSVRIGDWVKSIDQKAFYECTSLNEVHFPSTLKSIGYQAFYGCSSLKTIEISSNTKIETGAFLYTGLFYDGSNREVYYPKNDNLSAITSALRSSGVNTSNISFIEGNFIYDGGIRWSYQLNDDNTTVTIVKDALNYETAVKPLPTGMLTIPSTLAGYTVTGIGDWALSDCTGLTSVTIPNSVTSIGPCAFLRCTALKNVRFGTGVISIGGSAFSGCTSLESVHLPSSLASIGSNAFYGCAALKRVEMPANTVSIGSGAFANTDLIEVYYPKTANLSNLMSAFSDSGLDVKNIDFVEGSFDSYGGRTWSYKLNDDNSTVTIIKDALNPETAVKPLPTGKLTIPSTLGGHTVTGIGDWAFSGCTDLTVVAIPDSVTSIGPCAFLNCTSLVNIQFGTGVTSIGGTAFSGCTSLNKVHFPSSLTSIGSNAFYGCSALKRVEMPANTVSIGSAAFANTDLIEVYYPKTIVSVPALGSALRGAGVDTDNIDFVEGSFASAGGFVWSYKLNGDNRTVTIVKDALNYETAVNPLPTGVLTIPTALGGYTVTGIGNSAFENCTGLTKVTIGNNIKTIDHLAFNGCTSLRTVVFGTGLTSIGEKAFCDCTSLTSIDIPAGVSVGYEAFYGCSALTELTMGATTTFATGVFINTSLGTVYVPKNEINYAKSQLSSCGINIDSISFVELAVRSVTVGGFNWYFRVVDNKAIIYNDGACAVKYASSGEKPAGVLWIPATLDGYPVTTIGYQAFYECPNLQQVYFNGPTSLTTIEERAFYGCSTLSWVELGGTSLTSIGKEAFRATILGGSRSVDIPEGVTEIGDYAFADCSYLYLLKLPSTVKTIGEYAFYNCGFSPNYTVEIPEGVETIGASAFASNGGIPSVALPSTLTSIGLNAFDSYDLEHFGTLYVPYNDADRIVAMYSASGSAMPSTIVKQGSETVDVSGVYDVTYYFRVIDEAKNEVEIYDCTTTATESDWLILSIPQTLAGYDVKEIGGQAFGSMDCLSVSIPEGVTKIHNGAFAGCSKLTQVTIPSSLEFFGQGVFSGCEKLTEVNVGIGDTERAIEWLESSYLEDPGAVTIYEPTRTEQVGDYTWTFRLVNGEAQIYNNNLPAVDPAPDGEVVIPSELGGKPVTSLYRSFNECTDLTGAVIPSSVKEIESLAFRQCSSLESIDIPSSVTNIAYYAFGYCTHLASVSIPSSVEAINSYAFDKSKLATNPGECDVYVGYHDTDRVKGLLTSTSLPQDKVDSLHFIEGGYEVVDGCKWYYLFNEGGTTVSIAKKDRLGNDAWAVDPKPTGAVTIPATLDGYPVTGIGTIALAWSSDMESLAIGDDVTSIGAAAFDGCNKLKTVFVGYGRESTVRTLLSDSGFDVSDVDFVAGGFETDADGYTWYYRLIPGSAASGGYDAELCKVDFPQGEEYQMDVPAYLGGCRVTSIGERAFYDNDDLEIVCLPSCVTSIGDEAFANCGTIYSVTMDGVTTIGDGAFMNCIYLGTSLPEGLETIGDWAFANCQYLDTPIPEGVTEIGSYAFSGCSSLTDGAFPAGLESIGNNAFQDCTSLEAVELMGIYSIPMEAFKGCTALKSVAVSSLQYGIGSGAFSNTALDTVYVPEIGSTSTIKSKFEAYATGVNVNALTFIEPVQSVQIRDTSVSETEFTWYYRNVTDAQGESVEIYNNGDAAITFDGDDDVLYIMATAFGKPIRGFGEGALDDCDNLTTVYYQYTANRSDVVALFEAYVENYGQPWSGDIKFLMLWFSAYDKYSFTFGVDEEHNEATLIKAEVTVNEEVAITVPDTIGDRPVTGIGKGAFSGCSLMTEVTIPGSVESIGEGAFAGCTSLEKINVAEGKGGAITALLEESGLDLTGITVVDPAPAKTKDEVAAEVMANATIDLTGARPTITITTVPGFTYTVKEGDTLENMTYKSGEGKVKVGDGTEWTPTLQKYSGSGFYAIGVDVTE